MPVPLHRWPDGVRGIASGVRALAPRFSPSTPPAASGVDPTQDAQTRLPESAYPAMVRVAPRSTTLAASYEFHALNRLDIFCQSFGSSFLVGWAGDCALADERRRLTIPDAGLWMEQLADAGILALIVEA